MTPTFCNQHLPINELLFSPHLPYPPFPGILPPILPQIQPSTSSWRWAGCPGLCSAPLCLCLRCTTNCKSLNLHPHHDTSHLGTEPPVPHTGWVTPGLSRPREAMEGETCSCRQADIKFKDVLDGSLGIRLYFYSLYINATKV